MSFHCDKYPAVPMAVPKYFAGVGMVPPPAVGDTASFGLASGLAGAVGAVGAASATPDPTTVVSAAAALAAPADLKSVRRDRRDCSGLAIYQHHLSRPASIRPLNAAGMTYLRCVMPGDCALRTAFRRRIPGLHRVSAQLFRVTPPLVRAIWSTTSSWCGGQTGICRPLAPAGPAGCVRRWRMRCLRPPTADGIRPDAPAASRPWTPLRAVSKVGGGTGRDSVHDILQVHGALAGAPAHGQG